MATTYQVLIDYEDDQTEAATDDISADVVGLAWRLGMRAAYDCTSQPASAQIRVRNWDGTHSPERGDLTRGLRLRIYSDDGTTRRAHFTGFVRHITPDTGTQSERAAIIEAEGVAAQLTAQAVALPIMTNTHAGAVIDAVLDACQLRLYPSAPYCFIDWDGRNGIDDKLIYGEKNITRHLDAGISAFAYVGDTWRDGVPAWQAIHEAATSERGRFFIDRAGEAVFYNRHHIMLNTAISMTFSNDMHGLQYGYGDQTANEIAVMVQPRAVGWTDDILWALTTPQRIPAGRMQTIRAIYSDATGQPTGALDVAEPLPYVHYSATAAADGSGGDRTGAVEIDTAVNAGCAVLRVRNMTPRDVYLQTLTLRGTPLLLGDAVALVMTDKRRAALYGVLPQQIALPQVSSIEEAERIGLYELNRRRQPRGRVRTLSVWTAFHPAALGVELFDRIRIADAQTGHSADYLVIAEAHTVSHAGTRHVIDWTLEPADDDIYIIVDDADIDGDRVILPF